MPIELTCSGCGQTLRVPDDAAGKQARCPACQQVQPIPGGAPAGSPFAPQAGEPLYIRDEPQRVSGNPYGDPPDNPYVSPPAPPASSYPGSSYPGSRYPGNPAPRSYTRAHRGGAILTLGILSLLCNLCFIPCICALVIGNEDLQLMNSGRMDPSGRALTQVGMGLAVVGLVVNLLFTAASILPGLAR
jgi:hypothetical protein